MVPPRFLTITIMEDKMKRKLLFYCIILLSFFYIPNQFVKCYIFKANDIPILYSVDNYCCNQYILFWDYFFKHFNGRNLLVETYSQRNIFNRKNFNAIPPFPFFRDIMISDLLARPIVFDRKGNVALMKKNSFVYELPDALLYKYSFFITPNIR